jgi:hypothetical protein
MKALYQNKKVKVTKIIVIKEEFFKYPMLTQVKIEWKENGQTISDYVDANTVEFID